MDIKSIYTDTDSCTNPAKEYLNSLYGFIVLHLYITENIIVIRKSAIEAIQAKNIGDKEVTVIYSYHMNYTVKEDYVEVIKRMI